MDNFEAYYIRGTCYERKGDIEKAIKDFSYVLSKEENHVNAAFARGACYNRLGEFQKAIEDYNFALEIDDAKKQNLSSAKKSNKSV